MPDTVIERIDERLTALGMSGEAASKAAGLSRDFVRTLRRRPETRPLTDNLMKMARVLKCDVRYLLGETDLIGTSDGGGATEIRLPIRYEVAASGFLERDELPQRPYGYRTVPSVAPYAAAPQWLERVVSDSLDKLIPVGSLAHVVDAVALEYEPRHDDIVIVERSRAQGALVERTIKQVALTPAGPELWPRSHNPRHQQAIALHDGDDRSDDVTVQIVGKVIRSYMFFEPEAEEPEVA